MYLLVAYVGIQLELQHYNKKVRHMDTKISAVTFLYQYFVILTIILVKC